MKIKSNVWFHLEPIGYAIGFILIMGLLSNNAGASTAVPEQFRLSMAPTSVKADPAQPSKVVKEATPKDDRRADVKR